MANREPEGSVIDPSKEGERSEVNLKDEIYKLQQQMAEMYQAWAKGNPPPSYPANPAFILPLAQSKELPTTYSSPGFPTYHHYHGTTSQTPQAPPPKPVPYPPPPITPVFVAPLPATIEALCHTQENQYYPPEPTFKASEPYPYTPHFNHPVEAEKPPKNSDQKEIFRKVKSLEQSFRDMRGLGNQVSVAYKDLCLFPDVQLPAGFKIPKFDLYGGHGDPVAHLRGYCSKMRGDGGKDELLMAHFSQSMCGAALEWYTRQDASRWYIWDDMAQAFARHFQYNIDIVPDRLSLTKLEKKPNESFREYGFRWREQDARVNPPMEEEEMVKYFLQALEPTYYGHLISAIGKPFNDVVKMGEMVEEGLKANKIMSYSAIPATTQTIQNGIGELIGREKKENVAVVDSGAWSGSGSSPHRYNQSRPHHTYFQTPRKPPQYYPPNSVRSSVQPPGRSPWRTPAPHNASSPSQRFQTPKQGQGQEQKQRNSFTPIGESYASLFEKLEHLDLIKPLLGYTPDPQAKNFDPAVRCMYHSNVQGHSIENCRSLKREIERMIQEGTIVVNDSDREHANPLANLRTDVDDVEFLEPSG